LEELNQYPDFNNYLIFVLTKLTSEGKICFVTVWCFTNEVYACYVYQNIKMC